MNVPAGYYVSVEYDMQSERTFGPFMTRETAEGTVQILAAKQMVVGAGIYYSEEKKIE